MSQSCHPELLYRIALTMVPALGPIKAKKMIKFLGSPQAIFKEKQKTLIKIRGIGSRISDSITSMSLLDAAEKEMEFMFKHKITASYYQDPDYPIRLKECEDGPLLLYSRGDKGLHARRILSIVGTRRATSYGRDHCRKIVSELASMMNDLVIISGLAYGIDVIAHRAALENGLLTVAVLGHGLSTIYPQAHRDTAKRIIKQGVLTTDFHSKTGPERNNFLRRNRIIAGLADATLVIESAEKGGALITADLAASYNRDVLAVPGRVGDERSKGCNGLIKSQKAALVESAEDVINHLNWTEDISPVEKKPAPNISPSNDEQQILRQIRDFPGITPGIVSNHTGIPIHSVLAMLMEMELKQWISVEPGNQYHTRISVL